MMNVQLNCHMPDLTFHLGSTFGLRRKRRALEVDFGPTAAISITDCLNAARNHFHTIDGVDWLVVASGCCGIVCIGLGAWASKIAGAPSNRTEATSLIIVVMSPNLQKLWSK